MTGKCLNCRKRFDGISRTYCSWRCAEADALPKKLHKVMLLDIGHTKKLC